MGKRKANGYNKQQNKRAKHSSSYLQAYNSIKGVLFTIPTSRQRDASTEALNLLSHYSEELLDELDDEIVPVDPQEQQQQEVDKLIQEEVEQVDKIFELIEAGGEGYVFVRIKHPKLCPVKLVTHIFNQFVESEQNISCRYLTRIIPIQSTCHATEESVKKCVEPFIQKYLQEFSASGITRMFTTYSVVYKGVCCGGVNRKMILDIITPMFPMNHVVDLKRPQVAVYVYAIKSTVCFSIVKDYEKYMEFNVNDVRKYHEANNKKIENPSSSSAETVTTTEVTQEQQPEEEKSDSHATTTSEEKQVQQDQPKKKKKMKRKTVGDVRLF